MMRFSSAVKSCGASLVVVWWLALFQKFGTRYSQSQCISPTLFPG